MAQLNLTPEVNHDGTQWKFMGVYSKNREEWALTDLANIKNSVTSIAFYDTLGPLAVEFVIKQTELASVSCAGQYVSVLLKLKKDGKANSILNIISFDAVTED
jgi:long-chain acyl-CoA synthetase